MKQKKLILRVAALLAIVANVGFNYLSVQSEPTIKDISDRHATLFTPAPYAFSIWGLIYLSFVVYAIASLLPSQRPRDVYDRLAVPVIVLSGLESLWIAVFRQDYVVVSLVIIGCTLGIAAYGLLITKRAILAGSASRLVSVPFALLTGWLTVATLANVAMVLKGADAMNTLSAERTWSTTLLVIAVVAATAAAVYFRDGIVPLVVAWAALAIWANDSDVPNFAGIAALGSIASFVIGVMVEVWTHTSLSHRFKRFSMA